jgi:hypothetical protein
LRIRARPSGWRKREQEGSVAIYFALEFPEGVNEKTEFQAIPGESWFLMQRSHVL